MPARVDRVITRLFYFISNSRLWARFLIILWCFHVRRYLYVMNWWGLEMILTTFINHIQNFVFLEFCLFCAFFLHKRVLRCLTEPSQNLNPNFISFDTIMCVKCFQFSVFFLFILVLLPFLASIFSLLFYVTYASYTKV